MLRLITLEKNSFKTLVVSSSPLIILSPSSIAIFSFKIILFVNNSWTTLQKFLLSQKFFLFKLLKYSLTFLQKCYTQISLFCVSLFSSVLFLRKMFLSFVLSIIALEKFLFIKGEWLPLTYFFLQGVYWSRILFQDIKKSLTLWSQLFPKFFWESFL